MEIVTGLLLLTAVTATVLMLYFRAKNIRQQKAEQKRVAEMEARKAHQEKAQQLEKIFADAKAEHDEAKALEAGRAYYGFIRGGAMTADDERALTKDLDSIKTYRRYETLREEISNACISGNLVPLHRITDIAQYDVNLMYSDGLPLLCLAIKNKQLAAVKWLVENGADVNVTLQSPIDFNDRESLLVWCHDRGHCDSAEIGTYLVASGAVKKY